MRDRNPRAESLEKRMIVKKKYFVQRLQNRALIYNSYVRDAFTVMWFLAFGMDSIPFVACGPSWLVFKSILLPRYILDLHVDPVKRKVTF